MILQALKEYYDRKAADPDSGIAPYGWEYKAIPYIVEIDTEGNLVQIEDTREKNGRKHQSRVFLVPRSEVKTSNIKANLLWDKAEYIFPGIETDKDPVKLGQQREAFRAKVVNNLGDMSCIQPLLSFLSTDLSTRLAQEPCWAEIKRKNPYVSFRFQGELNLICHLREIKNKINAHNSSGKVGICLISGETAVISRINSKTFINRKNNSLVSFQKNSGYDSYGKEQGYNAPISESSEFAYVTALNTLLKSKRQSFSVGNGIYVCWSADNTNFETEFTMFFDDPETRDNPDQFSDNVRTLLGSIYTGTFVHNESSLRFYVLGLSPGGGTRISVRFWNSNTISEYAKNIGQYFDDLAIHKPHSFPQYFSLSRLLSSIAQQGDREKIPPNMAGEVVRSIICGLPFPHSMLQATIRRMRSGIKKRSKSGVVKIERVNPEIASIIKAYLNRYYRFYPNKHHKEVSINLDINQPSNGYQLGRLFATLEKIQEEANPGLNATITERFYGAACSTPVTVFANLLRLKNHHLAKLDSRGRVIYFERLLGDIIGKLSDFPAHLDLHEQGRFAIGYYHQRQSFFEPKAKKQGN